MDRSNQRRSLFRILRGLGKETSKPEPACEKFLLEVVCTRCAQKGDNCSAPESFGKRQAYRFLDETGPNAAAPTFGAGENEELDVKNLVFDDLCAVYPETQKARDILNPYFLRVDYDGSGSQKPINIESLKNNLWGGTSIRFKVVQGRRR